MARIIDIPKGETSSASVSCATKTQIWSGRLHEAIARLFDRCRIPGFIKPITLKDEVTGQTITIQTGHLFTIINIDGRDYYFHRLTGRFDGTGMGCR